MCRLTQAYNDGVYGFTTTQGVETVAYMTADGYDNGSFDSLQQGLDQYDAPQYRSECDRSWAAWQNS